MDGTDKPSRSTRRSIGYPTNRFMVVIDDAAKAATALAELRAAGIPTRDLEILRGPESADRIDGTGDVQGGAAPRLRARRPSPLSRTRSLPRRR